MSKGSKIIPLNAFPFRSKEKLRFSDTDSLGHINNTVFATLFEAGRIDFLFEPDHPSRPANSQFVIAQLHIDFLSELNWPGNVEIGTGVSRVGNSSFDLIQAIYVDKECVSTAHSVMVLMDVSSRRSTPLTPEMKARYLSYISSTKD